MSQDKREESNAVEDESRSYLRTASKIISNIQTFIVQNFLICIFIVAVIIALSYPLPGSYLAALEAGSGYFLIRIIEFCNNIIIFFISGLQLKTEDIIGLKDHKYAVLYGILSINFLTSLLAFGLIELPYPTNEFAIGLAIFATVPTTLGVGVALTTAAKGDQGLSLFLTITSNMLGIVTMPYLLQIYLRSSFHVRLDPVALLVRLCISIFIPSILGVLLRKYSSSVQTFMKTYKTQVSITSNSNLACIVWMTLSRARNLLLKQNIVELVCVLIAAAIMHMFYLLANYLVVTYVLKLKTKQAVSVIIMTSQKSSPVALVSR
jgi:solute carrier family 10 (sodium/bile acid cotransporter), member 7